LFLAPLVGHRTDRPVTASRLRDAINHFFAERCVPCEHLTSEIPVERLIFCGVASLIIERVEL
jgi:hypothetical protein